MKFFRWSRKVPKEHVRIANELFRSWNGRFHEIEYPPIVSTVQIAPNVFTEIGAPYSVRKLYFDGLWAEERAKTLSRVESTFNVVESLIPAKMRSEEIGDALEYIHRAMLRPDCPRWRVWLKVVSTCFWVSVNTVRQISSAILGKKAE